MTDVVTDDGAKLEPYRHTGYLLRRAQQLHVATWARIVSTDISSVQYSILVVLDREGELSQRELCDEVDLDRSTIADLVARMERRGLIARRRDPEDARRKTVGLTDHGRAERMRLQPLVDQVEDALTGALPSHARDCLRDTLRMMLAQQVPGTLTPLDSTPGLGQRRTGRAGRSTKASLTAPSALAQQCNRDPCPRPAPVLVNSSATTIPPSDADGFGLRPDPLHSKVPADLVRALRQYRLWAGGPPLRTMARRAGTEPSRQPSALPSTPRRCHGFEIVTATIAGCGGSEGDPRRFTTAWRAIRLSQHRDQVSTGEAQAPPRAWASPHRAPVPGQAQPR